MSPDKSRRQFLAQSSRFAFGAALLPMATQTAQPQQTFQTTGDLTIGLSQYSLRALFRSGSLNPLDFPKFALDEFRIRVIDFWDGGLPPDKIDDPAYLSKLAKNVASIGSDLFLFMASTFDLSPGQIEASRRQMETSLERTRHIGARYMRIFLKVPGTDAEAGADACVEALKPLADEAARRGLTLVVEPGNSPLSRQGAFLARVARELNHPSCRLMPDFGKLASDIYDGTRAMLPYTATVSCKMHSFDAQGNQPDFDYPRLLQMIVDSGYRGILAIEWEGRVLDPVAGVHASKALIERSLAAL